jgi:hypothetical protein
MVGPQGGKTGGFVGGGVSKVRHRVSPEFNDLRRELFESLGYLSSD